MLNEYVSNEAGKRKPEPIFRLDLYGPLCMTALTNKYHKKRTTINSTNSLVIWWNTTVLFVWTTASNIIHDYYVTVDIWNKPAWYAIRMVWCFFLVFIVDIIDGVNCSNSASIISAPLTCNYWKLNTLVLYVQHAICVSFRI